MDSKNESVLEQVGRLDAMSDELKETNIDECEISAEDAKTWLEIIGSFIGSIIKIV